MPELQDNTQKLYHVGLCKQDLRGATYAILPGDPGRVPKLAELFEEKLDLNFNREYKSMLVKVADNYVLICSTGMGGPSTAICLEELASLGIKKFIRVGTTGSIRADVNIGDLVINTGAVRLDGTSLHYAPLSYPAIADLQLTNALVHTATQNNIAHHVGLAVSSDTFYPGQERYNSFAGYVRLAFQGTMKEWQMLGALNYEMEIASLLVVARVCKLQAAAVCLVVAQRTESEKIADATTLAKLEQNYFQYIKKIIEYCCAQQS